MNFERAQELLQNAIGYTFNDAGLLKRAFVHASYGHGKSKVRNNERLEFLGDRVLGIVIAEALFHETETNEGGLARRLNALVRKETCADIARNIGLGGMLIMARSEDAQGGRDKDSILGDAMEALIAAIYLDSDLVTVRSVIKTLWAKQLDVAYQIDSRDPKSALQELSAAKRLKPPVYSLESRTGPDHRPVFNISVRVVGLGQASGEGSSKKEAETDAAKQLLAKVTS